MPSSSRSRLRSTAAGSGRDSRRPCLGTSLRTRAKHSAPITSVTEPNTLYDGGQPEDRIDEGTMALAIRGPSEVAVINVPDDSPELERSTEVMVNAAQHIASTTQR